MDKNITVIRQSDRRNSSYVPGTAQERVSLVWQLTCEAVSLSKKYDVKQPLQRHIVNIIRRPTGRTKDLADAEMLEEGQ